MGTKDVTRKMLEDYSEVFADIVNVLLFDGAQRIDPREFALFDIYEERGRKEGIAQGFTKGITQGKSEALDNAIKKLAAHYQAENPTLSRQECLEMASKILR